MKIQRFNDRGFLSDVVARGEWVWIAGTVSDPAIQGIAAQTQNVLEEFDRRLWACGARKDQLLSVNVWLADIDDWKPMNDVWSAWLGDIPSPARAVVQSALMKPFVVEMAAIACRDWPQ